MEEGKIEEVKNNGKNKRITKIRDDGTLRSIIINFFDVYKGKDYLTEVLQVEPTDNLENTSQLSSEVLGDTSDGNNSA